ncbi:hypothetical protein ABXJ76_04165 [Methylobacter sp. G7]|uniref:hypothetical protein n=1 Tax=Methylobacter sp. G7 TaxID=3230117 RepID=UPI003D804E63
MQITNEQKTIELHHNVMLWIHGNRHLSFEEITSTVQRMLKGAEPTVLLRYAAYSFVFQDLLTQKIEADDEVSSAHSELEIHRKAEDKERRVKDLITEKMVEVTMDYFKIVAMQRKNATGKRGENFKIVESKLKQHWQNHINHDKKATEAAILLEKTGIYKESKPQPKRATLEKYVREWQAEQK